MNSLNRTSSFYAFLAFVLMLGVTLPLFSQTATQQRAVVLNLEDKLAVQGFDVVAYFEGKALRGKAEFAFEYQGAVYHFATAQHMAQFKANPAKFEPQYGGWCAYAMGNDGSKVEIDPETFKILDGKLYLFYNFYFTNTLDKWNKDEPNLLKNASVNWLKISK